MYLRLEMKWKLAALPLIRCLPRQFSVNLPKKKKTAIWFFYDISEYEIIRRLVQSISYLGTKILLYKADTFFTLYSPMYDMRSEWCSKLSRNNLRLITSILPGHCRLRVHLFRMGIVSSPTCRWEWFKEIHSLNLWFITTSQEKKTRAMVRWKAWNCVC